MLIHLSIIIIQLRCTSAGKVWKSFSDSHEIGCFPFNYILLNPIELFNFFLKNLNEITELKDYLSMPFKGIYCYYDLMIEFDEIETSFCEWKTW